MNPEIYDTYRNLGWTAEETWQFLIGVSESNDNCPEED